MKIGVKLIIGFFVVALLVGFVGFFGINSSKIIQENNQVELEVRRLANLLDHLLIQVLQLIKTDNIDDYQNIKSNIENIRKEFDILHEEIDSFLHGFGGYQNINENIDDFTIISNELIAVHKEKLIQNREFSEKKHLEKDLRYKIHTPLFALRDMALTHILYESKIISKETMYQYKDQQHLDKWLETIEKVKNRVEKLDLPQDKKKVLLQDINRYQFIAQGIGEIVIEQEEIEAKELLKVKQLREIMNILDEDQEIIVNNIILKSRTLAKNTYLTLLIVIIIIFLVSIVLGLYIARSISKPIIKLRDAASEIGKGNLNMKIEIKSKDEIKELASAFNHMTNNLKKSRKELEKYSKTLERKVAQRTRELKGNVNELERFNKIAVGRELRMIKLKKEINELCKKLGEKPRYSVK